MAPPGSSLEAAAAQLAFFALVKSLPPQRPCPTISKFVKKLEGLQEVILLHLFLAWLLFLWLKKDLLDNLLGFGPLQEWCSDGLRKTGPIKLMGKSPYDLVGKGISLFTSYPKRTRI